MTNEEKLLINICQCYFGNKTLEIPENIDWQTFFNTAKNHNQIGICHCVFCENSTSAIPQDIRMLFTERFFDLVYIYTKQSATLADVKACFSNENIMFIAFKGAVIRDIYPVPESRAMGDIDLLISETDSSRAKKALKKIGFSLKSTNGTVDEYTRDGVDLEVHTRMISQFGENAFNDAFDNAVFEGNEGKLDDSYHFAYLIAHTAVHLKYTGAGIRLVLDLAIMLREKSIDIERAFQITDKLNLTVFAKVLLSVCYEWFGYGAQYVDNTERIREYLISDGVFGSLKDSTEKTVSRLMQVGAFDDDGDKQKSKLLLKLKLAFPSYDTLRKSDYIKFLDGHPLLLPLGWAYRLFYNLKNHRTHLLRTVKNIDDEKTLASAKEELEFFEEIGLL